jgi:hypothetical protein
MMQDLISLYVLQNTKKYLLMPFIFCIKIRGDEDKAASPRFKKQTVRVQDVFSWETMPGG